MHSQVERTPSGNPAPLDLQSFKVSASGSTNAPSRSMGMIVNGATPTLTH